MTAVALSYLRSAGVSTHPHSAVSMHPRSAAQRSRSSGHYTCDSGVGSNARSVYGWRLCSVPVALRIGHVLASPSSP
jgi:hypothetical protein